MSQSVAIVGGTHGNEFSGLTLIREWEKRPETLARPGLAVRTLWANPQAHQANKRYLDADLNRQFEPALLADPELTNYEQSRAKVINAQLGPKGQSQTDLVIDLHNTTSNMGPTLILIDNGLWERQLAAFVKARMPEAVILLEDAKSPAEWGYLCSVGKRGVMVEVGPQSQSVLRDDVLEQMATLTQLILDFASLAATEQLPALAQSVEAFRYLETLYLPVDEAGERTAVVHRQLEQNDFAPLKPGDPIFRHFDGTLVHYQGEEVVYPHFINEAAYYDSNAAFSLAQKIQLSVADGGY
ncbi:aspartoacylase [Ferrimonas balearica]|uniref:aspartoacylase n=1 Tax=Ferrimonas balearica TaxID=44012 RepID=UPI001C99F1FB|nr:aspartoacylase [Ferrimonas balearica]MBY5993902.1 aspartoacylase [Ferrimonas balearica]